MNHPKMLALLLVLPATIVVGSQDKPVATIGDRTITEEELDRLAADRLQRLRTEQYNIRRTVLEEHIARSLMEKEAKARGIRVEDLERVEIDQKVLPVTEDQKRAVYETNSQQFQGKSEAEAFSQIEANLKRVRVQEAKGRLMATLRARTPVRVLLAPPRVAVDSSNAPSTGPADAPVTIVEYSDFQCPACGRAYPTIKRLMEQYKGKVRLVFRDYPLPIHPLAPKAAEAAACAGDQGKFWEMHDEMFQNQQRLSVPDLKASAASLGVDISVFSSCLDSGRHAADWKAGIESARKYGVSSTPTFFVNGRMMVGAVPYQSFSQVVDEELQGIQQGPAAGVKEDGIQQVRDVGACSRDSRGGGVCVAPR